ncbi:hypothetical protein HK105_209028 [Polyrhizophydium stewartii]|uniref:rRNA-processing protein FYV7 n=1 Tax=Polyrhizophydium stewartii TaxID=2732419 RepID=A0ABR4MW46_9FUNG
MRVLESGDNGPAIEIADDHDTSDTGSDASEPEPGQAAQSNRKQSARARKPKPNPFSRAVERRDAERRKADEAREAERIRMQELRAQREAKEAHKAQYIAQRRRTQASLSKKTRKGQPVMANVIDHLLDKIKKSQQ